jgi:hypothetical protein
LTNPLFFLIIGSHLHNCAVGFPGPRGAGSRVYESFPDETTARRAWHAAHPISKTLWRWTSPSRSVQTQAIPVQPSTSLQHASSCWTLQYTLIDLHHSISIISHRKSSAQCAISWLGAALPCERG